MDAPSGQERAWAYIDDQFQAHVRRLQDFVRQPSISPQGLGMDECARLVRHYFEHLGARTEIVPTAGYPVVFGELDEGASKTLLVYMMYDTQPVDDRDGWSVEPLAAEIVDRPGLGKCLIARGAFNSKGPMMAFLNAVEAIRAADGRLPVNLLLVAEGEEELGSRHLPDFFHARLERLGRADAAFMPLPAQDTNGVVKLMYGVKGLCYFELECSGQRWGYGPQEYDIHSSAKAIVDSPAWRLVMALSTMVTGDGNRVVIPGFYDDVSPPSPKDARLLDQLARVFTPESMETEITSVKRWIGDETDVRRLLERFLFSPTLNIDGIWGGYTQPGSKTVLPHKVTAKIDVRLVPRMKPERVMELVRAHLDRTGYPDIAIRELSLVPWAKMDPESPLARTLEASTRRFGYNLEVWPHAPGTGPWYLLAGEPLKLDCVIGGLGHGARPHSPDEYFVIEGVPGISDYRECERSYVTFLYDYASGYGG